MCSVKHWEVFLFTLVFFWKHFDSCFLSVVICPGWAFLEKTSPCRSWSCAYPALRDTYFHLQIALPSMGIFMLCTVIQWQCSNAGWTMGNLQSVLFNIHMQMVTCQSCTSLQDGCLSWGCMTCGPGWHPVQQHGLAAAQATPGYPCPHVVSGQPASWISVPGNTNLLPIAILSQFCCCITARWSRNGWEALCSQTASSRGHQLQTHWRNWGALWLVWASLQGKKMKLKPKPIFLQ